MEPSSLSVMMKQPSEERRETEERHPLFAGLTVVVLMLLIGMTCVALMRPMDRPRGRAPTAHRLKQVALALWNYRLQHGSFPPAYVVDQQGRRMHSWRVLILPYLDETELASAYRFDEPWNGPHNRQLAGRIPTMFQCPGDEGASEGDTSFVAIVGPETMWPGTASLNVDHVTDGLSETILLVEMDGSGINWLEPNDLDFADMPFRVNAATTKSIRGHYEFGAYVAFGDSSVHGISTDTPEEIVRALCTANGGEPIPDEW